MKKYDVNFDFTSDIPGFWQEFWRNPDGLGHVTNYNDPDTKSKKLQSYHQCLWNKEVLKGELKSQTGKNGNLYFSYKDINLSSDAMINSFRYKNLPFNLKESLAKDKKDYKTFQEEYIKQSFLIGGMIIFPRHRNSLNQRRGIHPKIKDRFDLTLECIRRYYMGQGEFNPLKNVLEKDSRFFQLFGDFKGFIDFFLLQDWVSEKYQINFMLKFDNFESSPLPQNYEDYMILYHKQLKLVQKRNARIEKYLEKEANH